jgi:hypothetical protein
MHFRRVFVLVAVAVSAWASDAGAAPSKADEDLAETKFAEGLAAAKANNWVAARAAFTETYRLFPSQNVLLNLAGAELQTGHVLAAVDAYERLRADPGKLDKDQIESSLRVARARLAHVSLHLARKGKCTASLDNTTVPFDDDRAVDPGPHHATLACNGVNPERTEFSLADGERRAVELYPSVPASSSRTIGIVLTAGAVAALGTSAVTGGIAWSRHSDLEDSCGGTGTCDPNDISRAKTFVTISDITLAVGVVLAAGAIYALFVHPALVGSAIQGSLVGERRFTGVARF